MKTEAQKRANAKYNKAHTTQITLRLHNINDKDVIDYLNSKDNKQGYIKELIRADMEK